jgi:hypothetical protein
MHFGITLVEVGSIKNNSDPSMLSNANKAYYDYTTSSCLTSAYTTELVLLGSPESIKLENGGPNDGTYSSWIDYNNNGTFSSDELIITDQIISAYSQKTFNFTIPASAVTLEVPLRLRVIGDYSESSTSPCAQRDYGEVEDYAVVLKASSLGVDDFASKIAIVPNPSLGFLSISNNEKISEVTLTNLSGQRVFHKKYNKNNITLDINYLSPAIYFLQITSGNKMNTMKIIKK